MRYITSGFPNPLQTKSGLHISIRQANIKSTLQYETPCTQGYIVLHSAVVLLPFYQKPPQRLSLKETCRAGAHPSALAPRRALAPLEAHCAQLRLALKAQLLQIIPTALHMLKSATNRGRNLNLTVTAQILGTAQSLFTLDPSYSLAAELLRD